MTFEESGSKALDCYGGVARHYGAMKPPVWPRMMLPRRPQDALLYADSHVVGSTRGPGMRWTAGAALHGPSGPLRAPARFTARRAFSGWCGRFCSTKAASPIAPSDSLRLDEARAGGRPSGAFYLTRCAMDEDGQGSSGGGGVRGQYPGESTVPTPSSRCR